MVEFDLASDYLVSFFFVRDILYLDNMAMRCPALQGSRGASLIIYSVLNDLRFSLVVWETSVIFFKIMSLV